MDEEYNLTAVYKPVKKKWKNHSGISVPTIGYQFL